MGLDMFFLARRKGEGSKVEPNEVGYMRKNNAVFGWIETHVGEVENCVDLPMKKEHFEKLIDDCRFVLENRDKASEVMPTRPGFFFGSYDYDEWYFSDLEEAVTICGNILLSVDFDKYDVFFHAWW